MKKFIIFSILISVSFTFSCSSFIKDEQIPQIKKYENGIYILKKDIGKNNIRLLKGDEIKLYLHTGDNYIKVYCYPAHIDFLKSNRILLLYLFDDDFEKNLFDRKIFSEKLNSIIKSKK